MARIVIVRPGKCVRLRSTGCEGLPAPARGLGAPGRAVVRVRAGRESRPPHEIDLGTRSAREVRVRRGLGAALRFSRSGAGWRARPWDRLLWGRVLLWDAGTRTARPAGRLGGAAHSFGPLPERRRGSARVAEPWAGAPATNSCTTLVSAKPGSFV